MKYLNKWQRKQVKRAVKKAYDNEQLVRLNPLYVMCLMWEAADARRELTSYEELMNTYKAGVGKAGEHHYTVEKVGGSCELYRDRIIIGKFWCDKKVVDAIAAFLNAQAIADAAASKKEGE